MRLRDNTAMRPSSSEGGTRLHDDVGTLNRDPSTDQEESEDQYEAATDGQTRLAGDRSPTSLMKWDERRPNAETSRYARELKTIMATLAKGQSGQRTPQRIVVAGVTRGSEASIIARGLAATCAASGFRVLLVDANLDRPTVHRDFGVSNEVGLSNLLSTSDSPHRLAQSSGLPNLAVIAAGPAPANFSSLLARERVFHRLEPISGHFDYIIADGGGLSPSLVGRLSTGADNVIVAVKEHVSSIRELENMIRTLQGNAISEPAVLMIE